MGIYDEAYIGRVDAAIKSYSGKVTERQIRLARCINQSRDLINYWVSESLHGMPGTAAFGLLMATKALKVDPEVQMPDLFIRFIMTMDSKNFNHMWSEVEKIITYAAKGKSEP